MQLFQFEQTHKNTLDKTSHTALLSILSKHHNDRKWTLLLAPQNLPSKQELQRQAINTRHLVVIHKHQVSDLNEVITNAASSGNFSAIVTWQQEDTQQVRTHNIEVQADSLCDIYRVNIH